MNAPTSHSALALPETNFDLQAQPLTSRDLIFNPANFQALITVSELMATAGKAVPAHLRGNKGACFAIASSAMRWGFDPFAVAPKTYAVGDVIGYEGQLVIAIINNCGKLQGRLDYEWFGPWERIVGKFKTVESKTKKDDDGHPKKYIVPAWEPKDEEGLGIRVFATLKGESSPRVLELLMTQARTRNSTLWTEDPKQQIAYLAGRRWGRLHVPDAIMGIYTPDELAEREVKDMGPADVVAPKVDPALLSAGEAAARKGRAAYQEFWKSCTHMDRAILSEQTDHHERLKKIAAEADDARTVDDKPHAGASAVPAPAPSGAAASPAPAAAPAPAADSGQQDDGTFQPTYAKVFDMMKKAATEKNADALDVASDWIGEIPDADQRKELTEHYEAFKKEIAG